MVTIPQSQSVGCLGDAAGSALDFWSKGLWVRLPVGVLSSHLGQLNLSVQFSVTVEDISVSSTLHCNLQFSVAASLWRICDVSSINLRLQFPFNNNNNNNNNSAFHPSGVGKSSALLAGVKAGCVRLCRVASNIILCDSIWQATHHCRFSENFYTKLTGKKDLLLLINFCYRYLTAIRMKQQCF